jgi:hypothetical protein
MIRKEQLYEQILEQIDLTQETKKAVRVQMRHSPG